MERRRNNKYYVYAYFDKLWRFAYIGVGKKDRVVQHISEHDSSRKIEWLKKNEYKFRLLKTFATREDAENAETLAIEMAMLMPEKCIPGGLLNEKRGIDFHEFGKKFERLEDELNTGIDIDLHKVKEDFIKENRKAVVLNVIQSTGNDPFGDNDWISYCKGYKRYQYKTLANEILVRCKGKIVAHYENVTWEDDGEGGHIPSGTRKLSSIYNGAVLTGKARRSQQSVIYLYLPDYNHRYLWNKKLKKERLK